MGFLNSSTEQGETLGPGRAAKLPSYPQQSPHNQTSCPLGCAQDFIYLSKEQASFASAPKHPATRALESSSCWTELDTAPSSESSLPTPRRAPRGESRLSVPSSLTHSHLRPALLHWVPTSIHSSGFLPRSPFRTQPQMAPSGNPLSFALWASASCYLSCTSSVINDRLSHRPWRDQDLVVSVFPFWRRGRHSQQMFVTERMNGERGVISDNSGSSILE